MPGETVDNRIITSNLTVRLVVISGFIDMYRGRMFRVLDLGAAGESLEDKSSDHPRFVFTAPRTRLKHHRALSRDSAWTIRTTACVSSRRRLAVRWDQQYGSLTFAEMSRLSTCRSW
jgi:hypothetical protein